MPAATSAVTDATAPMPRTPSLPSGTRGGALRAGRVRDAHLPPNKRSFLRARQTVDHRAGLVTLALSRMTIGYRAAGDRGNRAVVTVMT